MTKRRKRAERKPDWDNPDLRIGPRWLGLYHDPGYPHLFVPRRFRWMGISINLGHPAARWFIALLAGVVIFAIVTELGAPPAP